jgi:hypothetical protein
MQSKRGGKRVAQMPKLAWEATAASYLTAFGEKRKKKKILHTYVNTYIPQ